MKNKENKKINLISLGCAKNLVDSEILLGGLNKTNIDLTDDPEKADTIVVNTCGFLDIAREESVDTICLLYTSPSPRDATLSRMPSSA